MALNVIVNQLQRSPGIIFEHDSGKTHSSRKILYSCRIIPMRGSWLDFDFDHKDILYVRIDRRRKMPATILLKAMGMTCEDILAYYYERERFRLEDGRVYRRVEEYNFRKDSAVSDIVGTDGKVVVAAGKPLTKGMWKRMIKAGVEYYEVRPESLETEYAAREIVDVQTGEVIAQAGDPFAAPVVEKCIAAGIVELESIFTTGAEVSSCLRDTLAMDKCEDMESAQVDIYKRLRPSSPHAGDISKLF